MPSSAKRTPLNRERVVTAALALADESGVAALSMRKLADRLGVEAMSLYHHVKNKDALLDAMVDAVFAEIHTPDPSGPWRLELERRSLSAREVLLRHRWAVGLMDSRSDPGPASLHHHDAVIGCLRGAGFSWSLTATAFALLDAHLYGFLIQELALPFEAGEVDLAELAGAITSSLPDGELQHFRDFTVEYALQPGYRFGAEFPIGLGIVLDGLESRLAGELSSPAPS